MSLPKGRTDFRFWHLTDIPATVTNVRFRGESGHVAELLRCPLMTQSGHYLEPKDES
jgi:hypothetical protein